MKRAFESYILQDLKTKIVLITGPRQSGKTTLAKSLYQTYNYFNYDLAEHRLALKELSWDRKKPLVIFDELHKMKNWKQWIKGIYDTEGAAPNILVTGSAKLDSYRKVGDSLAGRFFQYRLHPFDLKELVSNINENDAFDRLWHCGGFPEPFLKGEAQYYHRWRRTHLDMILRQDLFDLQSIRDIQAIETLVMLLKQRVGSPISYANLARDLEKDPNTIRRWLQLLESLYIVFKITPYEKNIARALLRAPKYYFYDSGQIDENDGAKLENIVANALLKELQFQEDSHGQSFQMHYLRTKEGKEIDFFVLINNVPHSLIEVKLSDATLSKNFQHFRRFFSTVKQLQLVKDLKLEKTYPSGVEIRNVIGWLSRINFTPADKV